MNKLPDPPLGEQWHNPFGLTVEQLNLGAGERLLLKSELDTRFTEFLWSLTMDSQGPQGWTSLYIPKVPVEAGCYKTTKLLPLTGVTVGSHWIRIPDNRLTKIIEIGPGGVTVQIGGGYIFVNHEDFKNYRKAVQVRHPLELSAFPPGTALRWKMAGPHKVSQF